DLRLGTRKLHSEHVGYNILILPMPPDQRYDELYQLVVDPHVAPALDRWLITYEPRAVIGGGEAADHQEWTCAATEAFSYGAGTNCPQLFNGQGTNTCNTNGATTRSCSVVGDYDYNGYTDTTWLYQCCELGGGVARLNKKVCRTGAGASTPCGTGGN